MGNVVCSGLMSLDGFVADESGNFDWAAPGEDVHSFINKLESRVGTYLLGRKTYEVLSVWDTFDTPDQPKVIRDFAKVWRAADKVVYSSQLTSVSTARTTIERTFDPVGVRALANLSDRDVSVSGPHLAAQAITAGIVDHFHLIIFPVIVGGGTSFFPEGVHVPLELVEQETLADGVVYLHYSRRR